MKDEISQQLAASLKEGGAILRGKKKAARSTTLRSVKGADHSSSPKHSAP